MVSTNDFIAGVPLLRNVVQSADSLATLHASMRVFRPSMLPSQHARQQLATSLQGMAGWFRDFARREASEPPWPESFEHVCSLLGVQPVGESNRVMAEQIAGELDQVSTRVFEIEDRSSPWFERLDALNCYLLSIAAPRRR